MTTAARTLATTRPDVDLTYEPDGTVHLADASPEGVAAAMAVLDRSVSCAAIETGPGAWVAAVRPVTAPPAVDVDALMAHALTFGCGATLDEAAGHALAYELHDGAVSALAVEHAARITVPSRVDAAVMAAVAA